MFKSLRRVSLALAWCCLPAFAAEKAPEPPPKQVGEFEATVALVIGANGDVVSATPDPSVPEVVRDLLKQRVALWKFAVPTFKGRPVQINARLRMTMQLAPTSEGGYGIRVIGAHITTLTDPPAAGARYTRRPHSTALVYVIKVDAEGRNADVQLVLPKKLSRTERTIDFATRTTIEDLPPQRRMVDGQPVACWDTLTLLYFFDGPPPDYTSEIKAISNSLTDKCPGTQLLTEVAGTTL